MTLLKSNPTVYPIFKSFVLIDINDHGWIWNRPTVKMDLCFLSNQGARRSDQLITLQDVTHDRDVNPTTNEIRGYDILPFDYRTINGKPTVNKRYLHNKWQMVEIFTLDIGMFVNVE